MKIPLKFFSGPSPNPALYHFSLFFLLTLADSASGFGSMGPISASFGDYGLFCAIDASGKQAVICWDANNSSSTASSSLHYSTVLPPMAALSGGEGFLCGILANTSQVLCWDSWDFLKALILFLPYLSPMLILMLLLKTCFGDGFSCGVIRDGGIACWGPNSGDLGVSGISENFVALTSGVDSLCGVSQMSGEVKCWGDNDSYGSPPVGIRFVSLAAGAQHFCGIREDSHGIECWGNFNASLIPKGSGFLAIASSNYLTCGIREGDLVLDCWFANVSGPADYDPPLQLCSPGLCTAGTCGEGMFAFNASLLNEPDLTSLCVRKDLKICSPCGFNCSEGFFPSSLCTLDADRVCTSCSLCQSSSCGDVLQAPVFTRDAAEALGSIASTTPDNWVFCFRIPANFGCLVREEETMSGLHSQPKQEADGNADEHPPASVAPCPGVAQVFRLSELKDATNGFKEFNELGRGSYGFVYKAVLADGRPVAVKRANAATIIHTNSRDFEMELEILCNVRHGNITLVYEFMPHGTLHDHLHGGLSTLNWSLRLKIAMQAAKGLEYLHKEVVPPIVHRDVKSSKILLDADWGARIADFGLLTPNERDLSADMRMDVYGFGVVLLEILSGRKAYDGDCMPPNIGKAAAIIDRYVALPRNVEPLLKLADIAELALREDPNERASMSDLALLLDQLMKEGLIL
ncbi:hypothetical protein Pfo_028785 [Paulownia fortunei]|nr:hypothetical protein Pfo_028785 [Paulownia fortunei]